MFLKYSGKTTHTVTEYNLQQQQQQNQEQQKLDAKSVLLQTKNFFWFIKTKPKKKKKKKSKVCAFANKEFLPIYQKKKRKKTQAKSALLQTENFFQVITYLSHIGQTWLIKIYLSDGVSKKLLWTGKSGKQWWIIHTYSPYLRDFFAVISPILLTTAT